MSFATRPPAFVATSPCSPADRRERRPQQPVAGYPDIPFFERAESAPRPVTQARPEATGARGLGQVIHMAATGIWVVKLNGRVVDINGRAHWSCQRDLAADAERAGMALSDLIVRTGAAD